MGKNFLSYAGPTLWALFLIAVATGFVFLFTIDMRSFANISWMVMNIATWFIIVMIFASPFDGSTGKKDALMGLGLQVLFNAVSVGIGYAILRCLGSSFNLGQSFFVGGATIVVLSIVGFLCCIIGSYIKREGLKTFLQVMALVAAKVLGVLLPVAFVGLLVWLLVK